jgi:hypothetical protein
LLRVRQSIDLEPPDLKIGEVSARWRWESAEPRMPQKRRDLISTFVAADGDGHKLMIFHYRESVLQSAQDGSGWSPTKDILVTEDGRDVSRKGKGLYEIRSTRGAMELKSDAPEAP